MLILKVYIANVEKQRYDSIAVEKYFREKKYIVKNLFLFQICGWGRNICMGYLNKENETKEVMTEDHWLKMGDLGFFDEDGFLTVLGKEENFITLNTGEVISPLRVRIFF